MLNTKQAELLGFQEYQRLPYPDTPLVLRNTAEAQARKHAYESGMLDALEDAYAAAEARAEEVEFARSTTIGSVVKPRMNTLRSYKYVLKKDAGGYDLEFSPDNYGVFDRVIMLRSGLDENGHSTVAAFNKHHPHHQDFAPLRRNIALLRNYLLCQLFEDGNFVTDPNTEEGRKDLQHLQALTQMADRLGGALASDSGKAKSFTERSADTLKHIFKGDDLSVPYTNAFMEAANIPDKGALVMYNYLMGLHETHGFKDIYSNDTPSNWPLLPREHTPFSDENMRRYSRSSKMAGNVIVYDQDVMSELRTAEKLTIHDRRISVDIARDILDKLRNLTASPSEQERVNRTSDEDQEKSKKLLQVAMGFRDALATLMDAAPEEVQNNKIFARTIQAFEQLGYRMKADTFHALQQEYEFTTAASFKKELDNAPESSKTEKSTDSLLAEVETGLREAKQAQDRNAARIAQREAQRAMRRAARSSEQATRVINNTIAQTYTNAVIRGASTRRLAKKAEDIQREAAEALAKQRQDAPLLNPEGNRTR